MVTALATDAYKFAMAQAGFPLRTETFYFSFREGGPQIVPWDLAGGVRDLVADLTVCAEDRAFAQSHGYAMSGAMEHVLAGGAESLEILAVPPRCWVLEREPILTVTGPSFLVSWLEPALVRLNYPIQLATALVQQDPSPRIFAATCEEHEQRIESVAAAMGVCIPAITREDASYEERVATTVRALIGAIGAAERVSELGMRSVTCTGQHRIALQACLREGITRTSNLQLAQELGMTPVGSMGHEHVQRWSTDRAAFEAMRDMRAAQPSYLLDTFDTMGSGIDAAIEAMRGCPHPCSIRYDSGNKFIQYLYACERLGELGLQPTHVLEDALDLAATRHFESLRAFTGWPAAKQLYGYGGYIVSDPHHQPLHRDRVSAVFKLSETGGTPCMKFGDAWGIGKQSVPGRPVTWRRLRGSGPFGMIGQQGEPIPDDYCLLSGNEEARERLRLCNVDSVRPPLGVAMDPEAVGYSPRTLETIQQIRVSSARGRHHPISSR